MAYNRAFSDTEIVTIAAVAAAALGGIVVGLGRGQANEARSASGPERLRELSSAGVARAQEVLPHRDELAARAHQIQIQARRLPDPRTADVSPVRDAFASLAENVRQSEVGHEFADFLHQLTEKDLPSPSVRERARGVVGKRDRRSSTSKQLGAIVSQVGAALAAAREKGTRSETDGTGSTAVNRATDVAATVRERLGATIERAGEHLPSTETSDNTRSRAVDAVQRRVAEPVSRAASTTKDTTAEALMAAVWLTAGAGLVYFGLLSSDRREQVKDFLCGAYEQARLLALDFQGYEAEM